jgi:hypothetical protein
VAAIWGGVGEVGTVRQVRWRRVAVLVLAPSENCADGRRRGWNDDVGASAEAPAVPFPPDPFVGWSGFVARREATAPAALIGAVRFDRRFPRTPSRATSSGAAAALSGIALEGDDVESSRRGCNRAAPASNEN